MDGFRTSAKTGDNIDESMKFLIEYIVEKISKIRINNNVERNSEIIDSSKHRNIDSFRIQQKKGCCWMLIFKIIIFNFKYKK